MKTVLFLATLVLYLLVYGAYLYVDSAIPFPHWGLKVWNYSCIGGLTLSMLILYLTGVETFIQQQLFVIAFIILLVTFTVIILVNLLIIGNPYYVLGVFYGANFVFTSMVLIAGVRHGIFKE